MAFDRSRFKGSTLNAIKEEQSRANKAMPKNEGGNRADFHKIGDGKNIFRIAPPHNPDEPAYRAKSTAFLECEVPKYDDNGDETGQTEIKKKNIFIATQHSATLKDDPILLYIAYVKKRANDEFPTDKDARQSFLAPITGWRGKDKKWNFGLNPDIRFVCYAWDGTGQLGRLELFPKMLDDMKKESVERNDDNLEIVPDIFADPNEGYPLVLTKGLDDKGKNSFSVSAELPKRGETWEDFFARTMITDAQLEDLSNRESLKELYADVYTTRDFDFALDGLMRFDKQYKFGIFENDEFLELISDLRNMVPEFKPKETTAPTEVVDAEVTDDDDTSTTEAMQPIQSAPKTQPISGTAQPTGGVPLPKMKAVINEYIAECYPENQMPENLTRDEVTEMYNLVLQGEELTGLPLKGETKQPVKESMANIDGMKPHKTPVSGGTTDSTGLSVADKIRQLRESRGK